ncbi:hypothetical protein PMKS-001224 [Pichia membranifaciens]|uniref:Uncharacterized protein n=1 Tax=Pichia membranifaciens TaxID=4926 RepID=A0A1Q2YDV7_9ASCO|nr:hypothetical protein PMKS-001224 [Pichia membranifaciens]
MSRIFDNLPSSLNSSREIPHKLAYEWSFWQHFRPTSVPSVSEDGNTNTTEESNQHSEIDTASHTETDTEKDSTLDKSTEAPSEADDETEKSDNADMRAAQYIEGTTLLTFPKVYSRDTRMEQTDTIDTVEQFWQSFCNLKSINDVPIDTEYFFFKKGIKPLWEDEFNKKGGRWSFSFSNSHLKYRKNLLCVFWELLLLRLIGGKFLSEDLELPLNDKTLDNKEFKEIQSKMHMSNAELNKLVLDDIAGIMVSVRSKKIILSIWNTHLSYEKFKKENYITGSVKNEEYNHFFRERLNPKTKHIYEEIGLTTYQFRQIIYEAVSQIFSDAIELVKTKDSAQDLQKIYKQKLFKYTPHFVDGYSANTKKTKYKTKRTSSDWDPYKNMSGNSYVGEKASYGDAERFSSLGKLRKKVEFTDEGLMVEELNVLSFKQKWNRRRRPAMKSRGSENSDGFDHHSSINGDEVDNF